MWNLERRRIWFFFCKIRSSRQTPRNIQMKSMSRKKLFLSSLALLTITPVLRASCTEIAQKNNEDLVNSGNAGGRGGAHNVCLLHFGSVAFSWLRGGAVCSVHSTELNWTWHRIAHSATGYSDKKRHNWRTHISLYSFQMHCALRTVYWNPSKRWSHKECWKVMHDNL